MHRPATYLVTLILVAWNLTACQDDELVGGVDASTLAVVYPEGEAGWFTSTVDGKLISDQPADAASLIFARPTTYQDQRFCISRYFRKNNGYTLETYVGVYPRIFKSYSPTPSRNSNTAFITGINPNGQEFWISDGLQINLHSSFQSSTGTFLYDNYPTDLVAWIMPDQYQLFTGLQNDEQREAAAYQTATGRLSLNLPTVPDASAQVSLLEYRRKDDFYAPAYLRGFYRSDNPGTQIEIPLADPYWQSGHFRQEVTLQNSTTRYQWILANDQYFTDLPGFDPKLTVNDPGFNGFDFESSLKNNQIVKVRWQAGNWTWDIYYPSFQPYGQGFELPQSLRFRGAPSGQDWNLKDITIFEFSSADNYDQYIDLKFDQAGRKIYDQEYSIISKTFLF